MASPEHPGDFAAGVFHTTVTERDSFRTCRRMWYLENVELLEPMNSVAWALIYGSLMHDALDTYYRSGRDMKATMETFAEAWELEDDRLARTGAFYTDEVKNEWREYGLKGETTLKYYDIHDRADKFFDKVVDVGVGFDAWRENITVEERYFIDILDPTGASTGALLSGRIDLVVKRKDGIWIVDHKNYASTPNWQALEVDDQLTGYCYIWWRMTGDLPRGAMYNVLLKDPPKPPRILVSGKMSVDKSQRTTYDLALECIEEHGLDSSDYAEFLELLRDAGWSRFFPRSDNVGRNIHQVQSFERHLAREYVDMQRALADPEERYPNPSQSTCRYCSMVPVCNAMEDGSDVADIMSTMYKRKEPRHTIPAEVVERLGKETDGTR